MGIKDGKIIGTHIIHGKGKNRLNIAILSDGYTNPQLPVFTMDAKSVVDYLFSLQPFNSKFVQSAFLFHRIDVSSTDSGADDPKACKGGTGVNPKTYFDSTFCGDGRIRRLITANSVIVNQVTRQEVPTAHHKLVIANSPIYGGSGGAVAVTAKGGSWKQVVVHELGHSLFGLADEYSYWSGCGVDDPSHNVYLGAEPAQANVTISKDIKTLKWKKLVSKKTPIPTLKNKDPKNCPKAADPYPHKPQVGTYEGAKYHHSGIYRGAYDCMMQHTGAPFCPVCQDRILKDLTHYMRLSFSFNAGKLPKGLEIAGDVKRISVTGSKVSFLGDINGRNYVRTTEMVFSSISIVAELIATVTSPSSVSPQGTVFFGLGVGEPDNAFYDEPRTGSHVYCRAAPERFANGYFGVTSENVENSVPSIAQGSGVGKHRLRFTWNAELKKIKFEIQKNYVSGAKFVPTASLDWLDCSKNGLSNKNAHVFFGGAGDISCDELVIRGASVADLKI